jgi:hypothetical protein
MGIRRISRPTFVARIFIVGRLFRILVRIIRANGVEANLITIDIANIVVSIGTRKLRPLNRVPNQGEDIIASRTSSVIGIDKDLESHGNILCFLSVEF